VAKSAVPRAVGGTALFHRNVVSGAGLFECVSIPLFTCRGPFPVPGESGHYRACVSRDSIAVRTPVALASANWLRYVRSVAGLTNHSHLAAKRDVY